MTASEPNVRAVVVDALVSMVSGVTGMVPPTDTPLPDFIQGPVDRAVSKIEAARDAEKARIAELEAALSDVERDAARYRWLCSAGPGFDSRPFVVLLDLDSTKSDVDTAIDAALSQQGKEQTP